MAYRRTRTRTSRAYSRRPSTRRTPSRRATNGGNQWSRQEIAFMRKYYRNHPTSWVARQLGRTVYSVRYKASDLSIKKARPSVWKSNDSFGPSRPTRRRRSKSSKWSYSTPKRRSTRRASSRRTRRASSRRSTRRTISRRRPRRIARRRTR